MDTYKRIVRHELIGLRIEIVDANNPSLIGIKGKIVDETKNTITVQNKKIIKTQVKMKIKMPKKTIEMDGKELVGRGEERIKK
ncbi:MAG: ribonuclease P protein subunit [Candidatus Woesearchaeota archaeon]